MFSHVCDRGIALFVNHSITRAGALAVLCVGALGCSGTQRARGAASARGFVQLEVEPADAVVYIDETYSGVVSQWFQQTVPVEPGLVLLELRAEGYIPERYDLEVASGEVVTLQVRLEPVLEDAEDLPAQAPVKQRRRPE